MTPFLAQDSTTDSIVIKDRNGTAFTTLKAGTAHSSIVLTAKLLKHGDLALHAPKEANIGYSFKLTWWSRKRPEIPKNPDVKLMIAFDEVMPNARKLRVTNNVVRISKGSVLEYKLHIDTKMPLKHARISVPRPAGFEVIQHPNVVGLACFEDRDEAFHFFVSSLPVGSIP